VKLLSETDIENLITPELATESAARAFAALSDGTAQVPQRMEIYRKRITGRCLIMPGLIGEEVFGVKVGGYVLDPGTPARRLSTGVIMVWDAQNLRPRGVLMSDRLNEHRTAAGLAAATRVLARPDCRTHALFGAGKLSFTAALYIALVRPHARLLIVGRTRPRVEELATRVRSTPAFAGMTVETDCSPHEAAGEADIITTVTTSSTPVFDGARIRPGTHINLGGANEKTKREVDDTAAGRAVFFLDTDGGCRVGSGDIAIPLASGVLKEDQIKGEIGAVILGRVAGRQSHDEITVFKSMGVAAQDLCLASALLDKAEAEGVGKDFDPVSG
jgi:ornithine cyclodeaminase